MCNPKCVHGTCDQPNSCVCHEGYTGSLCDQRKSCLINHNYVKMYFVTFEMKNIHCQGSLFCLFNKLVAWKKSFHYVIPIKVRVTHKLTLLWWRNQLKRSSRMRKVGCSNPSSYRLKSIKQTASLLNAEQQVRVSRVLGDDH